jgi:hypothetical protein
MAADSKVSVPLLAWGIVLVVGGVLVGAALFASNSGKKLNYNERSAILALRAIAAAEKTFREKDLDENGERDYWTADVAHLSTLKVDGGGPLLSQGLALSDPRPRAPSRLKTLPFCGYLFAAIREGPPKEDEPATHPTAFAFCAYPAEYGTSGRETFLIDQRGIVHSLDTQGKPPADWPLQAEPVIRIIEE